MTIEEIKASTERWLTADQIAPVLECAPNSIRRQAQSDPQKLGFPVTVIGSRVKVNRIRFLEFIGE